jgi:hypothetical protein
MAKEEKFSGELSVDTYSGSQKPKKKYIIQSKVNATTELYVGRLYFKFGPYEVLTRDIDNKKINDDVINHPDFLQQSEKYSYKEVKE